MKSSTKKLFAIALSTGLALLGSIYLTNFLLSNHQWLSDPLFSATGQVDKSINKSNSYYLLYAGSNSNSNSTKEDSNTSRTIESLISLNLGSDKSTYSTEDNIIIKGSVTNTTIPGINVSQTVEPLSSVPVLLQAIQDNNTIFRSVQTTNNEGKFLWSFHAPNDGTIFVSAEVAALLSPNRDVSIRGEPEEIISLVITKPWWPSAIIIGSIIAAFAVLVLLPRGFPGFGQWSIVFAGGLVIFGYIILYRYPPLDGAGNIAIATALFAPIAAFIIDLVRRERERRANLEAHVSEYRDGHLKKEVESLIEIHQEITGHQAIFNTNPSVTGFEQVLSNSAYLNSEIVKVGTIANLPGLRIDQYYYYIDLYNFFVQRKLTLTDDKQLLFNEPFKQLKMAYSALNEILYVMLIYAEGEIHTRFLSFPSIDFPPRISYPLMKRLIEKNIIKASEDKGTDRYEPPVLYGRSLLKIYKPKNTHKLMNLLSKQFITAYAELENKIAMIYSISRALGP